MSDDCEAGLESVKCEVWRGEWRVESREWRVWSVEFGVWCVACGECGV